MTFHIAPDADNEPTLWRKTPDDREPVALARKFELAPEVWHLAELGMWVAQGVPELCEECRDAIPDGEGCRHDGHVWCGSCFVERCPECRADLADDYAAEFSMDRDR